MRIGLALFPGLCQLDMTGPYEVLVRLPHAQVEVVAKTAAPVATDRGLTITPNVALADAPWFEGSDAGFRRRGWYHWLPVVEPRARA